MKEIWLIRHAESLANAGAATSTPLEIPLTDNGFAQANALANIISVRPDLVVVSPYIRSQQTAEPFLQRFEDMPVETWNVQEFTYLGITKCRGTSYEQRRPMVKAYWDSNDPNYSDSDGAESFDEFIDRVDQFFFRLNEHQTELAFVYTHEQFIKAIIYRNLYRNRPVDADFMRGYYGLMNAIRIPNASITKMLIDEDGSVYLSGIDEPLLNKDA